MSGLIVKNNEPKMFLGKEEIVGMDDNGFKMGDYFEDMGTFSFSGTFVSEDPTHEEFFKIASDTVPTPIKFYFMKESCERYWNNILFRLFIGPPKMVEDHFEFVGKFSDLTKTVKDGEVTLSVTGKIL